MSLDQLSFPPMNTESTKQSTDKPTTQFTKSKRLSQSQRKKIAAELKQQHQLIETAKRDLEANPKDQAAQGVLSTAEQVVASHTPSMDLIGVITVGADPRLHGKAESVSIPLPRPDPAADLKKGIFPEPREVSDEDSARALLRVQAGNDLLSQPDCPRRVCHRVCHRVCKDAKNGLRCSKGVACDGAHSLAEYQPPACSFGPQCRFVRYSNGAYHNAVEKPCGFLHPNEDICAYYTRSGRCPPVFKKRKGGSRKPRVE